MGIKDIIDHISGKTKQEITPEQKLHNATISRLKADAEQLLKSGKTSFTNFSYGPEGPSQQAWESTVVNDTGVFNKTNINNDGKKYQLYDMLFNNGEYAKVRVEENQIVSLLVKDNKDVFREINITDLPLKGCNITAEQILQTISSLQNYAQFSKQESEMSPHE